MRLFRSALVFAASLTTALSAEERVIAFKALKGQMKFDRSAFDVQPGESIRLEFENQDDLPHNLIVCAPGTEVVALANSQLEQADAAMKRDWVPANDAVLFHTNMVAPFEKTTLTFTAPEKPGRYPYVCTFPGHAALMQGVMNVVTKGPVLRDLRFTAYEGKWRNLPDFSILAPFRSGELESGLVEIRLNDYKNDFGVVFEGKLAVRTEGEHTFHLTSDDGARILIDGKEITSHDGIHPAGEIKQARIALHPGDHDFRLEYFQAQGEIQVFCAWEGPDFSVTPLSTWIPQGWNGEAANTAANPNLGMPIEVNQEPRIYRNFIQGAGKHGIGVGLPGGVNFAWDADNMNLALLWRGAFIDAARHWNGRGDGFQPPLGYDVTHPAQGQPFAVLESEVSPWPDPANTRPERQWLGYDLDSARIPTFHWKWRGLRIHDRIEPLLNHNHRTGLKRVITVEGEIPEGTWMRIADGDVTEQDGAFVRNTLRFEAPGAVKSGTGLMAPLRATTEILYTWPE